MRAARSDVAYVRFASVYRNFREAKDFENALAELSQPELAQSDDVKAEGAAEGGRDKPKAAGKTPPRSAE